jgi:acyl-CoA reductase-like NAD-dependent aldehyde dehydrogenase
MPVINPATEEVIGSAPVASAKDTANAVAAARQASGRHRGRGLRDSRGCVQRKAAATNIQLLLLGMGGSIGDSRARTPDAG